MTIYKLFIGYWKGVLAEGFVNRDYNFLTSENNKCEVTPNSNIYHNINVLIIDGGRE